MDSDLEEFLPDLDGWDMTEDEKRQFLGALLPILEAFVDVAFETDSTSLAMKEREVDRRPDADLRASLRELARQEYAANRQKADM